MGTAVEVKDVWKKYYNSYVLKGVDLTVEVGEFISIRGRSGVGKSTLLRLIGLLDKPDRGCVRLFGVDTSRLSDEEESNLRLRSIGFIFQSYNLIPWLTVVENVKLPMALAGVREGEMEDRARKLLNVFGLEKLADRYPGEVSGGEQQRVAVVRALANNPKLILADEPTSNLDPENSKLVVDMLLKACVEFKASVVMATTDVYEELPTNRDYVIVDGKLKHLNLKV
ncbi:MAG: ABC transporter ATP-binding protein [Candidatus Bathyarchaeia archaeon]